MMGLRLWDDGAFVQSHTVRNGRARRRADLNFWLLAVDVSSLRELSQVSKPAGLNRR